MFSIGMTTTTKQKFYRVIVVFPDNTEKEWEERSTAKNAMDKIANNVADILRHCDITVKSIHVKPL